MAPVSCLGPATTPFDSGTRGAHLNTLAGHYSGVTSVAFSSDGTRIVSGSHDYTLRFWDTASGAHVNTSGHSSGVTSVTFSPDGTRVVSASYDCTLRLWDVASGAHLNASQPNLGYFIEDGWICCLPRERRLCWLPVSCRLAPGCELEWSGNRVAVGTDDGRVVVFDFTGMDAYLENL